MAAQAVGDGKVACLVRRRVGKGIQGACAPMAERVRCLQRGWRSGRRSRSTQSTRRGSLTLALGLVWALREQRGAYGCHLPARGGPPTCAGLLLAWVSVVMSHRWGAIGVLGVLGDLGALGKAR